MSEVIDDFVKDSDVFNTRKLREKDDWYSRYLLRKNPEIMRIFSSIIYCVVHELSNFSNAK